MTAGGEAEPADRGGPGGTRLRVFAEPEALAGAAAAEILRRAAEGVARSGRFTLALAGGSTPNRTYELLGERIAAPDAARLDWRRVHFFWSDERMVPLNHPESNQGAAVSRLRNARRIPERSFHPVRAEGGDAARAAREYDRELRRALASGPEGPALPRLDLVLLGLGEDGHTASLFAGGAALDERRRLAAASVAPGGRGSRVTMTLPVINAAAAVIFLVAGVGKAEAVKRVLGSRASSALPATLVRPVDGELWWYLDAASASRLAAGIAGA